MTQETMYEDLPQAELRQAVADMVDRIGGSPGHASKQYLDHLRSEIARLQQELQARKQMNALLSLISQYGWALWDHSDIIPYDEQTFRYFVGTKEEFDRTFS